LAGLVIGISAALLLFKYVRYETTYDTENPNAKNIWRVFNQTLDGKTIVTQDANTHSAVGPTLKADVPGVVDYARLYCGETPEITILANNQPFDIKKYYATDQGFMRMFPQKIIYGNAKNCLVAPHTAIITKTNAQRIFGNENAINKRLKITNGMMAGDYTITAVMDDVPENTHLKFDLLVSYSTRYATGHKDNFESYWDYNYFQLADNANAELVRNRLAQINEQFLKKENIRLEIQPFTKIHLHSNLTYELEPNGNARIVQFLGMVGLLILFIAFINYINLTTAFANERAKEVGVRKAMGASRGNLTLQFLIESVVMGCLALGISVLIVNLTINQFSTFIGSSLNNNTTSFDIEFWATSVGIIGLLSLITGIYPALQISGYKPIEVIRGKFTLGNSAILRKSLVIAQFAGSVILIIGVLKVKYQLDFLKSHDLGVKLDQIVAIKSVPNENNNDSLGRQKLAIFKSESAKLVGLNKVASSNIVPGLGVNTISGSSRPIHWVKKPDFAKITSYFVETDEHFFDLYNIKVLAGKHQFFENRSERYRTVTINKSMLSSLGFTSADKAIGEQIAYENSENGATMTIGAVIEDFHVESLKIPPHPTLYYCFAPDQLKYLSIKMEANQIKNSLASLQDIWKKVYPSQPFNYWFLDENFSNQYRTETQFGKTFGLFSILAILISCLGLLGLVAYSIQRRNKEIGIRKVLGATVFGITVLLSKEYIKLIILAIVVATPIAYFLIEKWLQDFAYRIEISWWIFAISGLLAIAIALLSISYQAIKAALMNPVKSLKTE
jgi:putative ABC transport system permease protein